MVSCRNASAGRSGAIGGILAMQNRLLRHGDREQVGNRVKCASGPDTPEPPAPLMLFIRLETSEIKGDRTNFGVGDCRRGQRRHHAATAARDLEELLSIVIERQEWRSIAAKGVGRMTHGADTHEGLLTRGDIRCPRPRRCRPQHNNSSKKRDCRWVLCTSSNKEIHYGNVRIVKNGWRWSRSRSRGYGSTSSYTVNLAVRLAEIGPISRGGLKCRQGTAPFSVF